MVEYAKQTCHGRWMSESYEPGLVSVITPTYNRAKYLVKAMDSVLNQFYRPIELVVVDDGSTDGTGEVVGEWKKKLTSECDFELRYFYQANKGAPAARNHGLIESRGEFVLFHDSDDILDKMRIGLQVQNLIEHFADLCCGSWKWLHSDKRSYSCPNQSSDPLLDLLENRIQGGNSCWMIRRCLIKKVGGYDENLACYQDFDLTFRLLAARPKVVFQPEALTLVRATHSQRLSAIRATERGWHILLEVHKKILQYLKSRFNCPKYLCPEKNNLISSAISAYSLGYYDVAQEFELLSRQTSVDCVWGDSTIKKAAFIIGGVKLCGIIKRVSRRDLSF